MKDKSTSQTKQEPTIDTLRTVYSEIKEDIRVEEGRLQNVSYILTAGFFIIASVFLAKTITLETTFHRTAFTSLLLAIYFTVGGYLGSLRRHTMNRRKWILF